MSLKDRLKQFDAHSSVDKEFRVYTVQGAVLSVATVVIILYLVTTEVYFNFQVTLHERVHVNATTARGLEMEFDISLSNVACSQLQVDAADTLGQPQSLHLDQQHHIWKHRIKVMEDGRVQPIGVKQKFEMGSTLRSESELIMEAKSSGALQAQVQADGEQSSPEETCGSCYGAGEEGECCNTCEDVKRTYKQKGWVLRTDLVDIQQCKQEAARNLAADEADDEGCNVHGVVALSTGGGNLHLAPGKDAVAGGAYTILDMLLDSFHEWNVSHTIHKVRFGPDYPSAINQLDQESRTIEDTYGMYQYYIKIVPTLYKFRNGTSVTTNQYSVTEHLRHVRPGSNRGLPGVFFFYEVSPLHVEITEGYRRGWIAFFTSVCAIVGGVVTVMGMVDQFLFSSKQGRRDSALMR